MKRLVPFLVVAAALVAPSAAFANCVVLKVERGAFVESGAGRVAYRVAGDRAERVAVRLGNSSAAEVEVLDGLAAGAPADTFRSTAGNSSAPGPAKPTFASLPRCTASGNAVVAPGDRLDGAGLDLGPVTSRLRVHARQQVRAADAIGETRVIVRHRNP